MTSIVQPQGNTRHITADCQICGRESSIDQAPFPFMGEAEKGVMFEKSDTEVHNIGCTPPQPPATHATRARGCQSFVLKLIIRV